MFDKTILRCFNMTAKTRKEKMPEVKDKRVRLQKSEKLKVALEKGRIVALLGELLKRQRERLALSQNDIKERLNYKYYNFISMIENGACKIPFNRIADVVKAYEFENEFILIFIKALHPDIWDVIKTIKLNIDSFNTQTPVSAIDKSIDAMFKNKLRKYQIPTAIYW